MTIKSLSMLGVPLILLLTLGGCAATTKPITGMSSTQLDLPIGHTVAEAKSAITRKVQPYMLDSDAEKYRDEVLSEISDNDLILLPNDDASRIGLVQRAVETEMMSTISVNEKNMFRMTKIMPDLHRNGEKISSFNLNQKPDSLSGNYNGEFEIGSNFCRTYNFKQLCGLREWYKVAFNGTYNVGGSSLEITYNVNLIDHETAIGLKSQFSLEPLSPQLPKLALNAVSGVKRNADARFKKVVNSKTQKIIAMLKNRVKKGLEIQEKIGESTFNVVFETAVARLQRQLDIIRYDKEASTFYYNITDQISFLNEKVPVTVTLIVKLFPERSATVAVYKVQYDTISDKLTDRELLSQEKVKSIATTRINKLEAVLKE